MGISIFSYIPILLGVLSILFGVIIWKKQKITLIHGNSNTNIKKEDLKGYTESIGKSYIILGISMFTLIILRITDNDIYDFICFILWMLGFVTAIVNIIKTQKKYKTGIWN